MESEQRGFIQQAASWLALPCLSSDSNRHIHTHDNTKHGDVKKDKTKTVMEPELGESREVSFLTSKNSFSTDKTTPRQNSGFTKTVLKPETPFIFGVMKNG